MNKISNLQVFLVDDDIAVRKSLTQTLQLADINTLSFASPVEALKKIEINWPGVLITDINMPEMSGLEFMRVVQKKDSDIPVILITGYGDVSIAVDAIRKGAWDFIEKPFSNDHLVDTVNRAQAVRHLTLENRQLKQSLQEQGAPGPRILGDSPPMQDLRKWLNQVVQTPTDILLQGETGTGKELVARYLHEQSDRQPYNFVAINCGAVPENLIESELFGHETGAFTGADKRRIGKFEHAQNGTLFLDEIESMPLNLQIKVLRVLEERQLERLGGNQIIELDIRVIAATKVELNTLVESHEFRRDLLYRLNIVTIHIPSLRYRKEDIPLLFQHFSLIAAARYQREIIPLSPESMQQLLSHNWPGNVRELRNLAERFVIMGESYTFSDSLPGNQKDFHKELQSRMTLPEQVELFERQIIENTLKKQIGSIKDTMFSLGLPRKTLYDKMKKYGLDRKRYTQPDKPGSANI